MATDDSTHALPVGIEREHFNKRLLRIVHSEGPVVYTHLHQQSWGRRRRKRRRRVGGGGGGGGGGRVERGREGGGGGEGGGYC